MVTRIRCMLDVGLMDDLRLVRKRWGPNCSLVSRRVLSWLMTSFITCLFDGSLFEEEIVCFGIWWWLCGLYKILYLLYFCGHDWLAWNQTCDRGQCTITCDLGVWYSLNSSVQLVHQAAIQLDKLSAGEDWFREIVLFNVSPIQTVLTTPYYTFCE